MSAICSDSNLISNYYYYERILIRAYVSLKNPNLTPCFKKCKTLCQGVKVRPT